MSPPVIEPVLDARMGLGESPCWSVREQALWWVDIEAPALWRFHPETGATHTFPMPAAIGAFALYADGAALVALRTGLFRFEPASDAFTALAKPDYDQATVRFNDGRADPAGRFWVGSIDETRQNAAGKLYSWDAAGGLVARESGLTVANGVAFSPDGRTLYHADTPTYTIRAYDLDLATGTIANRRIFAQVPEGLGRPDGAAVDSEGGYWTALGRQGNLARFTPAGKLDRVVELPVKRPSMCAFGGADLGTLFITSISSGMGAEELAAQPLAGMILAFRPGVTGLAENYVKR